MPTKFIPTPKRDILRTGHRPKPDSKTHATKQNTDPRWGIVPYTPPSDEELDAIPWEQIFELGVR